MSLCDIAIHQRAKSPEQKALRRQQILQAASECFAQQSFERANLADVAAKAGVTKAALYRYFRSKEVLFLTLYGELLQQLMADAEQQPVAQDAATACVDLMCRHPEFCQLNAILHTVLEQNLSAEEAREFKLELLPLMQRFSQLIARWMNISEPDAITLLLHVQQAMIGCWHICHPSSAVSEAISKPPLTFLQRDFRTTLHQHLSWLFAGFRGDRQ
ncbi:TetR family transcriptional regulator [Bacterioplanes sanyensis]|uniref:TetR family transcriptional regulator n=1 Tax=Bacterioplanes sanyensis TaxID=1249553 RepID=A0A222FM74_9GAMM|nr:TetR family transcriptional regulator [Bacterioplanes sanyensis]ASP40118.1 TetR family transcriptional regulator [Bacterioplanes sanyensis]